MTRSSKPSDKVDLSDPEFYSQISGIWLIKCGQTFAFGRKKANQGSLPCLTIGFYQQNLDSWRAFV